MGKKAQEYLVIDACVARSAGDESDPTSTSSIARKTLSLVRHHKHRLVMNQAIHDEWMKHRSRYSRTWYKSMHDRGLVLHLGDTTDHELRVKIAQCAPTNTAKEQLLKDCCLIEAALKKGETIISLDKKARNAFHTVATTVDEIRHLRWLNPADSRDRCHEWLQGVAPMPDHCSLGALGLSKK